MTDREPTACCAHLVVHYATTDQGDGSVRGHWECGTCQHRFHPHEAELAKRLRALRTTSWEPSGKDYDHSIHSDTDPYAWADFFLATFPNCGADRDMMGGWFANAMMAKHDADAAEKLADPVSGSEYHQRQEMLLATAVMRDWIAEDDPSLTAHMPTTDLIGTALALRGECDRLRSKESQRELAAASAPGHEGGDGGSNPSVAAISAESRDSGEDEIEIVIERFDNAEDRLYEADAFADLVAIARRYREARDQYRDMNLRQLGLIRVAERERNAAPALLNEIERLRAEVRHLCVHGAEPTDEEWVALRACVETLEEALDAAKKVGDG